MNNNQYIEGTIESLLSSIADGVKEAQESLNDLPPVDLYGRPLPSYHIPYVDFDLAVNLSMRHTSEADIRSNHLPVIKRMRFNPVNQSQHAEISSHISGRIVSVPPGEGLPLVELIAEEDQENRSAKQRGIRILARNSHGETLPNHKVEVNINWELSIPLNAGIPFNRRSAARLESSLLVTRHDGIAETQLYFGSNLKVGAVVLLDINMGNSMTRLSVIR
ncbi:MAG: hypothetical protein EA373_11485 [Oceanospirillales bacterium]|nr:MAG: hypothetical protein EA373_11485 [Oceanospirillales bacterium]